ncbi:MAG: DUF4835 family protein [Crocinitomix sp.]|nr:DUF4835 family protein [Crocinitomix sp.]
MKKTLFILLLLIQTLGGTAQELNCQVSIIPAPALQVGPVEKEIFTELESAIYDFMNTTKWTNDIFEIEERINCNILITLTDLPSTTTFKGKVQVQSSRPVFNTSYNSTVFNHVDSDFSINYLRNSAILPMSNYQYRDNLSAILSFYAYMILGYDYDSFSLKGGDPYFKSAQQIANNAKNSGDEGWSASASKKRNRFWMVDNVLQPVFSPLRNAYYNYHRQGLDQFYTDQSIGRKKILETLQSLDKVQRSRPGSMNLQLFLTSKTAELINIFSQSEIKEKNAAVSILKKLDPVNSSNYQEILN